MDRLFRKGWPVLATLAFIGSSGALQAQERGACGQPLALTQGSYVISGPDAAPIDSVISIARREPVYIEIEVLAQTGVTFETASQNADPVVILFDESGQPVRGDDDGAGDLNARLGAQLSPGRYCAQVSTITDIPTGGPAPQGFNAAIPIQIRTGIEPGSGGCFSDPALVHLDQSLSTGFAALELNARAPSAYVFTVEDGTMLSIFARSNELDTLLTLEDASGNPIATDDDSGGGTNSYIGIDYGLSAGEYCVSVSSYDGSNGPANLTISEYSADAVDQLGSGAPSNPCGDPSTTSIGESVLGAGATSLRLNELLSDSTHDLSFELATPMSLRLTATSNDLDTIMWLYSADGTKIAENDDGDGLGTDSRIQSDTVLPAGAYCVSVGPYGGTGSGGFALEVTELSEQVLLAEAYAAGDLLPPVSAGIEMTDLGLLHRNLRTDNAGGETRWYLFEVENESFVVVDSASLGAVSEIALFDFEGTGQRIAHSLADSEGLNTRLVKKIGSGIYALAVVPDNASGNSMGASALSIQRYIRPPRQ